jgi:hypothetical protein
MSSVAEEVPRLSPSRSKTDFLNHLGFDERDPDQNALYLEMMVSQRKAKRLDLQH